jgi:exosome complex RNA-binding protein Csl4
MKSMRINELAAVVAVCGVLMAGAVSSSFAETRPPAMTLASNLIGEEISVYGLRQQPQANLRGDWIEGRIVDIHRSNNRLTIRDRRGTIEVRTQGNVPVFFRGDRYRVRDLERGDTIRVQYRDQNRHSIRATRIDVLHSVSHSGRRAHRDSSLSGEVVSTNRNRDSVSLSIGGGRLAMVDVRQVTDERGRPLRADSFRRGDRVTFFGSYDGHGNFRAHSVTWARR